MRGRNQSRPPNQPRVPEQPRAPKPLRAPRLAEWFLCAAIVDEVAREGLAGDLAEEYEERRHRAFGLAARGWYWRSALVLSFRFGWERTRLRTGSSPTTPDPEHHTPAPRRGDSLVQTFLQDLRFAVRSLAKEYGFTTVAVLTLAVGVGANTAMFSALNAIFMTPLPYEEPERLVIANTTFDGNVNWTSSAQDYEDYRAQNDAFETFALMAGFPMSMVATGGVEAQMVDTQWVSWDLFRALRVAPATGRDFRADEAELESAGVAIISYAYWQTVFGGNTEAQHLGVFGDDA